jgi:hypothetical protein
MFIFHLEFFSSRENFSLRLIGSQTEWNLILQFKYWKKVLGKTLFFLEEKENDVVLIELGENTT